jgi:AcrR family transcriptional regulator
MTWSKEDREGPRGYHHGNLKEALLRAALELIAQKGPAGFTFAEAARWAGVSPAAPYRHFRDRDELLASVALRGFKRFEAALARAWDDGRPDVFVALDRLGKAYLGIRARRAGVLFGDVRGRYPAHDQSRTTRGGRTRLRSAARRCRKASRARAAADPASGVDGGVAHLGDVAWHCFLYSGAAMRRGAPCRCRPKNSSRPKCWFISAASG